MLFNSSIDFFAENSVTKISDKLVPIKRQKERFYEVRGNEPKKFAKWPSIVAEAVAVNYYQLIRTALGRILP